jgi:hypothetical protein
MPFQNGVWLRVFEVPDPVLKQPLEDFLDFLADLDPEIRIEC